MTPTLFRAFRDLAHQKAGLELRDGKEAWLATRIGRRMRELGVADASEYLARVRGDASGDEQIRFVDSISTNLTSFYREAAHFDALAKAATRVAARGERRFRIWSAATASGEEAYTAALTLAEALAGTEVEHRIFATDISTRALAAARQGRYTESQLAPVPERLRRRYFLPSQRHGAAPGEPLYEVSSELRERVLFGRVNLAHPPWPMGAGLDAILCRNVLIYFGAPVRQRIVQELTGLLRHGGLLMLGHAETLSGLRTSLEVVGPSVYRRPRGG